MKRLLFLIALLAPVLSFSQVKQVSVDDAQDLLLADAILVDVRTNEEVKELAYQSEGMLHIPLSELKDRMQELPKDKTLIFACGSGFRSQTAIEQVAEAGITNTLNLQGGMQEWQGKGYPVIVDGVAPAAKACCAKGSADGKACCSGKKEGTEKTCKSGSSDSGKACCSKDGMKKNGKS